VQDNILEKYRYLVKKLNEKKFFGLNGIYTGYTIAIAFETMYSTYNKKEMSKSFYRCFRMILSTIFFNIYGINMEIPNKILFFVRSMTDTRNQEFYNLKIQINNSCMWIARPNRISQLFSLDVILYNCFLSIYFYIKLLVIKISLNERMVLTSHMICLFWYNRKLKYINFNKYNTLVTWCDTEAIGNLLTQIFKNKNKKTITLQHGCGFYPNVDGKDWRSLNVNLETMISDYYFCWGECSKQQAIKYGVKSEILCVGPHQFIDKKYHSNKNNNRYIGVFLTGRCFECLRWEEENRKLIFLANNYCVKNNVKYKLRLHPTLDFKEYKNLINLDYFDGFSHLNESFAEFSDQVGICLVGNSSCFIELLLKGKIVFKVKNKEINIYENSDYFVIENEEEIKEKIRNSDIYKQKRNELIKFNIADGNIRENYVKAFKKVLKENDD